MLALPSLIYKMTPWWLTRKVLRMKRGLTLGSRVAAIDAAGRFLLVRHTYSPGWIFPGGGVEFGETCESAAIRELQEEANVIVTGSIELHGIFSNHDHFPGDHLLFYTAREFEVKPFTPNAEIAAAEFFSPEDLPRDILPSSRRRIEELLGQAQRSFHW